MTPAGRIVARALAAGAALTAADLILAALIHAR